MSSVIMLEHITFKLNYFKQSFRGITELSGVTSVVEIL